MNRVNDTLSDALGKFVVENKVCTILSMRGMSVTEKHLLSVLERFRASFVES